MKKGMVKLLSGESILITLKMMVVGLLVSVAGWLFMFLKNQFGAAGMVLLVFWFVFALFLTGFIANRFWGWK